MNKAQKEKAEALAARIRAIVGLSPAEDDKLEAIAADLETLAAE